MKISLGYCGPTDCCLILNHSERQDEFLIESLGWKILDCFWNISKQTGELPDRLGNVLHRNFDEFNK